MSKKEEAFTLFDQGFSPISQEVKQLGLKAQTRYNYHLEWKKLRGIAGQESTPFTEKHTGGETIGSISEASSPPKPRTKKEEPSSESELPGEASTPPEEADMPEEEAEDEEGASPGGISQEIPDETLGNVSEAATGGNGKKGKEAAGTEGKVPTKVAEDGIKCTVFLSLQTLMLYKIAAAEQAKYVEEGEDELTLGDFLDTCAEDFFSVRGKKLGLIVEPRG